jgi:hypothetical protein
MHPRQVLLGVLGLVLAAAAVRADVPKTVKILGQDYTVTANSRVGTFKNGTTVNLQKGGGGALSDADVAKKANLCFVQGADASADRLFVVAAHQDDADATSDGFYLLTGTDANGVFSPATSNATVFFRGNRDVHGRPQNITFINDANTGVKKDRNIYMCTFTGQNRLRFYDLDTLNGTAANAFRDLNVFSRKEHSDGCPSTAPDQDDDGDVNAPDGDFQVGAMAPNGMMIVAGVDSGDIALGVIDPVKGTSFFPVKTSLTTATGGAIDVSTSQPHSFVRLTGDDYLMIVTDPGTGANAAEGDLNSQTMYRLTITLPADLTKAAADSIKVKVVGKEDLPALKLGQSPTAKIQGVAVGREVAAGKPVLYMADWAGNLLTLRPNVTLTAGQ